MRLRFSEKQSLYHSLGQLLRSGVTFPAALENLARTSRGGLRRLLGDLTHAVAGGLTVGEAFAAQRPLVSEMEAGIVAAVERAGRLEGGLAQLARYFGALETARASVWKKAAYPLFLLHFGILMLGAPTLITEGFAVYAREIGSILGLLYGAAIVIALGIPLLRDAGATSAAVDAGLRMLPVVGSIRSNFATSRFCATYEMQLQAGVNVLDGLAAAARASRSGLIDAAVRRALPEIRSGSQVGPLLAVSQAFPESMMRGFSVGEETGKLDEELDRLTEEHQERALSSLNTLADWLPKLIYVGVCLYIAYRIVSWYGSYLQQVMSLTGQE